MAYQDTKRRIDPQNFLQSSIAHYGEYSRLHNAGIKVGRQAEEALRLRYNDPSKMTAQQMELSDPLNIRAAVDTHKQGGNINTYNSTNDLEKSYDRILSGGKQESGGSDTLGLSQEDFDHYSSLARDMGLNKGGGALSANDLRQVREREAAKAPPASPAPAEAPAAPPPTEYERDQIARQETGNPWANRFSGHSSQTAEPDWYDVITDKTNQAAMGMYGQIGDDLRSDYTMMADRSKTTEKDSRSYLKQYINQLM